MGTNGPVVMGDASPLVVGSVTSANVATRQYDDKLAQVARDPVAGLDIRPRKIFAEELVLTQALYIGSGVRILPGTITASMITAETLASISANLGVVYSGRIVCAPVPGHPEYGDGITVSTSADGTGSRVELYGDGLTVYDSNGVAKTTVNTEGLGIRNDSGAAPGTQERLSLADGLGTEYGMLFYDNASHVVSLLASDADSILSISMVLAAQDLLQMSGDRVLIMSGTGQTFDISADTLTMANTDSTLAATVTIYGDLVVADVSGAVAGTIGCVEVTASSLVNAPAMTAANDMIFTAGASSGDQFIFKRTTTTILSTDDNGDWNFVNDVAAVDGRFSGAMSAHSYTLVDGVSHVYAQRTTTQSINNITWTTVIFATEIVDSLSEYNASTGVFTAINEGWYQVCCNTLSDSASWAQGEYWMASIVTTDRTFYGDRVIMPATSYTTWLQSGVSAVVYLHASDTVEIQVYHNQGAAVNVYNSAPWCWLTIDRLLG